MPAIGCESDAFAVRRPDGLLIIAHIKSQPGQRIARPLVHPNIRVAGPNIESELLTIGRKVRITPV